MKRLPLSERLFLELYEGRPDVGMHYKELPKPARSLAKRGLVRFVQCQSAHGSSFVVYLNQPAEQVAVQS